MSSKKILFSAVTLDVGGIETALVTLLNYLAEQKENIESAESGEAIDKLENEFKYDITLVLEKKQGLFLDELNPQIKIVEYTPNNNKIIPIRKAINLLKQWKFKLQYKNKFDFSCSYATYSNPGAFVARTASEKSALWCHMDYLGLFEQDKKKVKKFFGEKHFEEFKKIIFVSEKSKHTFLQVFPYMASRTLHINNLIDYKKIIKQSEEIIKHDKKTSDDTENTDITKTKISTISENLRDNESQVLFANVSRHDEKQKRITRIIKAAKLLNKEKMNFKVILVGAGVDSNDYKELVKKYKLTEKVIFLGRKKNPYPYMKEADCILLTSDYEGSPVTFTEAMVLNKPIITTDVAGAEQIKEKYGYVVDKKINAIKKAMKDYIQNGYEIKEKFEPEEYNKTIISEIEKIINNI